ncbi:MAG: tRNA (N6-isopentenyl adenosine(37)-C2)-methylthiotransferase MiaB [Bacteroidales bacterium]|nr:tRNA (N6-isopentenyl adenosine(37)-C2)-methylthiotransferase MiaB [Bacteroidales bacterium]
MNIIKNKPKLYLETYGCQMNVADSEVVVSIMNDNGFVITNNLSEADIVFINTCSIRENAEKRVRARLDVFRQQKKKKPELLIGIIGCMAERLKEKLIEEEKSVDIIIGPDAYRNLPNLISIAESGQKAINVILSQEETYAEINPVRLGQNKISAFVSIMRGCDNFCSYCVVPYTRGRERSRNPQTILNEIKNLINNGYKEVTLLGQNIDKYKWENKENNEVINFVQLLEKVALLEPSMRVRFSTPFPKDMTDEVLFTITKYDNICKCIHLPVQSGSSEVLKKMKRGYSREWYMDRIKAIWEIIPECSITTDIITGFCSETEDDHKKTLSLMKWAKYDFAYMFKYSERPDTYAQKKLGDDIPDETKSRRLTEIIELQNKLSKESNEKDIGKVFEVLIEGLSKRSNEFFSGRNSQNKVIVFPKENYKIGGYVNVKVTDCTSATLKGEVLV